MPGLHLRRLDLGDRLHRRDAGPRRDRPDLRPRPGRRRGEDHAPHRGDPRRPHARRRRPGSTSSRRSPTGTASRSSRTARRRSGRPTRAAASAAFGTAGTYSFNEYKTITCGDGGMIVTDDKELYERAFAMHDQGHAPDRLESKYAPRPFLGMNFRMTEMSGGRARRPGPQARHDHVAPAGQQGDRQGHARGGPVPRLPDPDRSGRRPGDPPRRRAPDQRDGRQGGRGGRLADPLRVGLAHLQQDEPPAREADDQRQGLPVRLRRPEPFARRLPGRDAAPDRRAPGRAR